MSEPPGGLHALLIETQRRLEALYAIEPQPPVVDFLIPEDQAPNYPGGGSRTLVVQEGEDVSVGVLLEVAPAARPLYHFAASLAAGGVVTLLAAAAEIAHRLGLPEEVPLGYLELARGAVAAARDAVAAGRPLASAITGPAARDERATLARHLEALRQLDSRQLPLAMFLTLETLHQVGHLAAPPRD